MPATFQVIALSSLDPAGIDNRSEPKLLYPDALTAARQLKAQGKAFRVLIEGTVTVDQIDALKDQGALLDQS